VPEAPRIHTGILDRREARGGRRFQDWEKNDEVVRIGNCRPEGGMGVPTVDRRGFAAQSPPVIAEELRNPLRGPGGILVTARMYPGHH
jgi:hypothetical protein